MEGGSVVVMSKMGAMYQNPGDVIQWRILECEWDSYQFVDPGSGEAVFMCNFPAGVKNCKNTPNGSKLS